MSDDIILAIGDGAYRSARNNSMSISDSKDIQQDVVLKAIEYDNEHGLVFSTMNKAVAWGSKCAKNLIIDRKRKRSIKLTCIDYVRYWEFI